jgi:hypothetical protein
MRMQILLWLIGPLYYEKHCLFIFWNFPNFQRNIDMNKKKYSW